MTVVSITDRHAKVEAATARLEAMLDELTSTETFRAYLRTMAQFHRYSWANVAMIMSQRPDASSVNSYNRWRELGRQVKKGERGIAIWAPTFRKGDDDEHELRGFRLVYVFDVSQTEGDDLPTGPLPVELDGDHHRGAWALNVLSHIIRDHDITIVRENTRPALGYWNRSSRVIALDTSLRGPQALKTLTHELAHALCDHRGSIAKSDAETVAESVAFVVLDWLGIDTSAYSVPYIAHWGEDVDTLKANLQTIRSVSQSIISLIEHAATPRQLAA